MNLKVYRVYNLKLKIRYNTLFALSVTDETLLHNRSEIEDLKYNTYIKLHLYVMDIKGFYPFINELVNDVLKFKEENLSRAKEIFNSLNPKLKTMVSIHIRLTDFKKHLKVHWNMTFATDAYFEKAMEYFHTKYKVSIT